MLNQRIVMMPVVGVMRGFITMVIVVVVGMILVGMCCMWCDHDRSIGNGMCMVGMRIRIDLTEVNYQEDSS